MKSIVTNKYDINQNDIYERILSYYDDISIDDALLFSAGVILILFNQLDTCDEFFKILSEAKDLLIENDGGVS